MQHIGEEIMHLAAQLAAGTCRWLELIAEFDRRDGWHEEGQRSCAEWVAWHCGLTPRAAREHVRVARSLERLPRTTALFRRGELSFSKVRAISRLEDVAHEEAVLRLATHATAGELDRIVAGHRGVVALERDADATRQRRFMTLRPREDGSVTIHGRLSAEEGAVLQAALDHFRTQLWADAPRPERDAESPEAARDEVVGEFADPEPDDGELWRAEDRRRAASADALVRLADAALAAGTRAGRSAPERHQVVVHVDVAALASPSSAAEPARLADGTALAPSVLRRLCCDGSTATLVEAGGRAIDVGRRTRTIPPAMRRALTARDRGCQFPGCRATHHLDAHHVEHWADGGATCTDNLLLLCRRHHVALHEGGFRVELGDGGQPTFRRSDGRVLPSVPAVGCPDGRPSRLPQRKPGARGIRRGDKLPYDHPDAVAVLLRAAGPGADPG